MFNKIHNRRVRRRLWKFVTKPGIFFRDYFLKRYPLQVVADVNRPRQHDLRNDLFPAPSTETILGGFIEPDFAVDVVYTWVELNDVDFQRQRDAYLALGRDQFVPEACSDARFKNRDELRYSLRSIVEYMPWVRRIFIVTNGQVPRWLDKEHPKISVVPHTEIIPDEYLPTFNSHVIESCIHRIPGLAKHYIYFNDDVFVLRNLAKTEFFTENGLVRAFVTNGVIPDGPHIPTDTPSAWAMKNARALLYSKTGRYLNVKIAHTFQPQRRDVAEEADQLFEDALHNCRKNRFRQRNDILCTGWAYPCLAYITGRGVFSRTQGWYFGIRDRSAIPLYASLLNLKGRDECPASVCLNDHFDPNRHQDFTNFEEHLRAFLEAYFPIPAPFEVEAVDTKIDA